MACRHAPTAQVPQYAGIMSDAGQRRDRHVSMQSPRVSVKSPRQILKSWEAVRPSEPAHRNDREHAGRVSVPLTALRMS